MIKRFFPLLMAALLAASCGTTQSPQDKLTVNDKKIDKIIAQMTLEEKVNMLHSKTNMSSAGVERLGIADMHYADGPFGIREEGVPNGFQSAGWTLDSATYFPTGSALAATWSKEMAYLYGTGMGTEARLRGKDVILGPAVNIQRLPVGGRTYEYLSEDPILSAALALGYTKGVQDQGTAVCIKHFAVNNQEFERGYENNVVDEQTLREIYLKPFEIVVRKAHPNMVMSSYCRLNGDYCATTYDLMTGVLREEWGFDGFVMTDWWNSADKLRHAEAGNDLVMPGVRGEYAALVAALKDGKVRRADVQHAAVNILKTYVRIALSRRR